MAQQSSKVFGWTYGSRSAASGFSDWIKIVQADSVLGEIPKNESAFQQWMLEKGYYERMANNAVESSVLYQQAREEFYGPCGYGSNGTIMIGIEVIKWNPKTKYDLYVSYGSKKSNGTKEEEYQFHADVELTDSFQLVDHKIVDLIKQGYSFRKVNGVWEGQPRDRRGVKSNPPDSEFDKDLQLFTFDQPYLGTYRIKFNREYDSYTVTIPPRTNVPNIYNIEDIYDCTVWAFYEDENGDPQYAKLEIDIPEEAKDCIQYYWDSETNTWKIESGNQWGYDLDGDGEFDGGSDDPCTCWLCGGVGKLPDCEESATVDCTCYICEGDGIIEGCQEEDSYDDDSDTGGSSGGQTDASGTCGILHIQFNRCRQDEIVRKYVEKVSCDKVDTETEDQG